VAGSQRPWIGRLGAVREPVDLVPDQEDRNDDDDHGHDAQDQAQRARVSLERRAGEVGRDGVDTSPDGSASHGGGHEVAPSHLTGASQKCGVSTQDGHESAEEHHLATLPVEQVTRDLQLAFVKPDLRPVPYRQRVSALVPDQVADVVADDHRRDSYDEDQPWVELVGTARVSPGDDQSRLTRQRHAQALDDDQREHGPVPVAGDEVVDVHCAANGRARSPLEGAAHLSVR
jgi:hypothetical protein